MVHEKPIFLSTPGLQDLREKKKKKKKKLKKFNQLGKIFKHPETCS